MSDEYGCVTHPRVGLMVRDDLTGKPQTIIRIDYDKYGNAGIWLDSDYLGGGRFPWEISEL